MQTWDRGSKNYAEEAVAKLKLEAKQAEAILEKHKEAVKNQNL